MKNFESNNSEVVEGDFEILEDQEVNPEAALESDFQKELEIFENKKKAIFSWGDRIVDNFNDVFNVVYNRKGAAILSLSLLTTGLTSVVLKQLKEGKSDLATYVESFEENPEYKKLKYELVELVGKENISMIETFSIVNNDFYEKSQDRDNFVVDSETMGEDFSEYFKKVFSPQNSFMPENMLNDVSHVNFFGNDKDAFPEKYGEKLENSTTAGTCYTHHINIYKNNFADKDYASYLSITSTMFHELIHSNDWVKDAEMGHLERLQLLDSVIERLKSEDRFKSSYVENIESPDGVKETVYLRATEYLAEIGSEYFMNPAGLKENFPEDFIIVDNLVKQHDQDFDVFEVNNKIMAEISDRTDSYDYAYSTTEEPVINEERIRDIESINPFSFTMIGENVDVNTSKKY